MSDLGLANWSTLVSGFVHPAKVIILEAMLWTGRPTSATELEKMAGGDPVLSAFSFHLKQLAKAGILEVVGCLKVKRSQSNKKETFFYFGDKPEWMSQPPLLRDSADPLTRLALTPQAAPAICVQPPYELGVHDLMMCWPLNSSPFENTKG